MKRPRHTQNNLRYLSQIFSTAFIKKIVEKEKADLFISKVSNHFKLKITNNTTNKEIIKKTYNQLSKYYRCEYIYKNSLINYIIDHYSTKNTSVFDEFSIASSKADLTLLNGDFKIFEIKTELDDFSRLPSQIADYQKVANKVNIVTTKKNINKLLEEYTNSSVGILYLTEKNTIIEAKPANINTDFFEFDALFKLLRKSEYITLTNKFFNTIPDVPNTRIFEECYNLLSKINILEFQKETIELLKLRNKKNLTLLEQSKIPNELIYVCNAINMNEKKYNTLKNFLNQKHHVSTIS